jgi:2-C-methyl-D-erythritol 2,4-cyclodiphosphate synthase
VTVRSGIGIDVHPLVEGRDLILGGVKVPFEKGLAGHSDGDVLIHAVIDALLGCAALGDIGTHFPSSDPKYKGIASTLLLDATLDLIAEADWRLEFLDATILAERPILKPHMPLIKNSLAEALHTSPENVNVKAKTTDSLGFIGRGEGIAAMAIATVTR